jgi:hypothetical protein
MGSDQAKTFGPTISALIRDNLPPEQYTLWDSKERGMSLLDTHQCVHTHDPFFRGATRRHEVDQGSLRLLGR